MEKKYFYVLAFDSTSHAIQTEKKAAAEFRIATIPTPRELTNDCGLAIKFLDHDEREILKFYYALSVPASLYRMSEEKHQGKRDAEAVPQNCK